MCLRNKEGGGRGLVGGTHRLPTTIAAIAEFPIAPADTRHHLPPCADGRLNGIMGLQPGNGPRRREISGISRIGEGDSEMMIAIGQAMNWAAMVWYCSRLEKVGGMRFLHLRISPNRKMVISGCMSRRR